MGHTVTFYPTHPKTQSWQEVYQDIPRNIEVMANAAAPQLEYFLKKRSLQYSIILVSRPENMAIVKNILAKGFINRNNTRVIYDAEALFSPREAAKQKLKGMELSEQQIAEMLSAELELTKECNAVFTTSNKEKQSFLEHGQRKTTVLRHSVEPKLSQNAFSDRKNILFVGPLYNDESPNTDSIYWFIKDIFPLIRQQLPDMQFIHAGINESSRIQALNKDSVKMMGKVNDLTELYNTARIFIAPTRFAAGVPIKIYEAAAHGLPIVCTSLLAEQLEWENEKDLLVADTPEAFAAQCIRLYQDETLWEKLRTNALERIKNECSPEAFYQTLKDTISP
ncbi:MAG: glycosyltransferase [Gammaproteobacteria bacterium]